MAKPVPKHVGAAARAQFFLIGRALVHGAIDRDTFETLIHEWLAIISPLLNDSGFEGKDMTWAVNEILLESLTLFEKEDREKIEAKLKTLRTPLR